MALSNGKVNFSCLYDKKYLFETWSEMPREIGLLLLQRNWETEAASSLMRTFQRLDPRSLIKTFLGHEADERLI